MDTRLVSTACAVAWVAFLVGGCASGAAPRSSLPGTTTAGPQLERDTVALVLGLEKVADCTCNEHKIVGREVGAAGATSVSERWTVSRCGTILRYTITFTGSPSGGTLIALDPVPQVVQKKPDSPVPTLPKEFDDVWYRAGNRGFAIPAYSASGKLLVTEQRVVFGDGAGAIEIGVNEIKSVCWGKMAPDSFNEWVIVTYGRPEKKAGFKDGSRLGWGTGSPSIMASLSSILERRPAR